MDLSFEEKISVINNEINKRSGKWRLRAITWMDFDDVKQLIKIHVYNKWYQWDQSKPLEPWLNKIITNQITNILRDNYTSFSRPCLRCGGNQGGDLCALYEKQCSSCPLYRGWVKRKKNAHDIKLAVSYNDEKNENIQERVRSRPEDDVNYDFTLNKIHDGMKEKLKPEHYIIYKSLYIDNEEEEVLANRLGYKPNYYNNKNKWKQLENYKKRFIKVVKEIIAEEDLFERGR